MRSRRSRPLVAVAGLALLLAVAAPAAGVRKRLGSGPRVYLRLDPPALPTTTRIGDTIRIAGRVRYAGRSVAVLQARAGTPNPGRWRALAGRSLKPGGGRFSLSWRVPASLSFKPLALRVAVLVRGRAAASTIPVQTIVGPAKRSCAPAVPPAVNIPVGSGWVVGGAYIVGGPFPGIDQCFSQNYTVTATDTATQAVTATQTVAGGHSYTIVLPAGSYTLSAGGCATHAAVTVTAGRQTRADVTCDVP